MPRSERVFIFTLFIIICSAFVASAANAGSVRLTWTDNLVRENGTPMTKADIAKYELRYVQQGGGMKQGTKTAKGNTNGYLLTLPVSATYLFTIRVFDKSGVPSQWSVGVLKYVP